MGGYGSGRRSGRPTVGECLRIEFPSLKQRGYLKSGCEVSGTWSWDCRGVHSGSIGLKTRLRCDGDNRMFLDYQVGGVPVHQDIPLEGVPMRFSGKRWWAICPVLGIRCGTLVYARRYDRFVSVKASGYAYGSQTEDTLDRMRRRSEKLEKRYKGLSKYTRKGTRRRLRDEWIHYDTVADELFCILAGRLWGRLKKTEASINRRTAAKSRKAGKAE